MTLAAVDPVRARQEIAACIGPIRVDADAEEVSFYSEEGHAEVALLRSRNDCKWRW
jgi:hypothetical protein